MNVIKQVAKIHNVSEEEVRREIQAVIHAAMQSKDPQVQKLSLIHISEPTRR